ncbi:MAG: ATP-binding protein, partial [Gammaproteobacteria bacterium]|nr:ATP-binding protein [Gammaproteobacteria bacterium]
MREFNTSGPCDPALHYTVMREALMAVCSEKVKKGRYITLFAPRQSGKTTFFKLLLNALEKDFTTVWISFENLKSASKEEFYQGLNHKLRRGLAKHGIQPEFIIRSSISLEYFFENTSDLPKPLVLVIDEF